MRIAYFAFGMGKNINAWRYIQYFVDRGHDVHVITHEPVKLDSRVKVHVFDRIWALDHLSFWWSALGFRRIVRKIKPDILHGHFLEYYGHMCALSRFHPCLVTVWGSDIYYYKERRLRDRLLTRYTLRAVDRITVDSIDMWKEVRKYHNDDNKIDLIIMGIDSELFRAGDGGEIRGRYGLGDKPVVVSTRHFTPLYNIDTIIRAIPIVLKEAPEARFLLKNAYGGEENKLKALAKEIGVEHAVHFISEVPYEAMPSLYQAGDIFVSVPNSDGTPSSLLEAMACGAVPIVSDVASVREWVQDDVNGYVVKAKDHAGLADRIIRLVRNKELCRNFRRTNFEIIRERGLYDVNMKKLEMTYYNLVNARRAPARG